MARLRGINVGRADRVAMADLRTLLESLGTAHDQPEAALAALARADWGAEKLHVGAHAFYLWCANGILQSKLAVALLRDWGDTVTTRNGATLEKILTLLQARGQRSHGRRSWPRMTRG